MSNNNTLGDQSRSFGYADSQLAGQLMTPQVIPRGMMSPASHQSMRPGFVPQQMTGQFHHSQHPRTPCYGKPPDMQINTPCPNARYLESSPKNYFYGGPTASYNSPNQMNSMRYNEGNFYQHQVYPQIPQQQNYYKQHQMPPMPHQNSGFYQEMPHQNMGYPQRMMSEQISPHSWNSPYKMQPQILEGSGFGDCTMQKMMQTNKMDRFHSSNSSIQPGHPAVLKERYMSPPQMSSGFDPRMYNNYGYEGPMEKYKMNSMKYPEEQMYGMQNPALHASQQIGNYLPGKRLEHFSNHPNPHFQMGNYPTGGSYPPDAKVAPSEMDKMKFHNPNPYCNPADPAYYKTNHPEEVNHFKHSQRKLLYPNTPTHMDEGVIKKPTDAELETYHSPSTETCSGSSSPSYFEVDVKYSLPSSGFPLFSSPSSSASQKANLIDSAIKTESLSSINFLISQSQSSISQTFSQLPPLSLEKQKPSMITTGTVSITTSVTVPMTTSSLNQSLLLQSTKCITSTVKMATHSKNNSMVVVKKEFPPIQRQVGRGDEGLPKVVTPRKNKRRKVFEEVEMVSAGRASAIQRYVTVPYKWRRIIENESVYYISPSRVRLESLKEICQYLLTDGTCKCGLLCPLHVDQVFVFDCAVKSRYMTVEEVFNSSNNVASLCYHKRKYKQSVSAAIIAASGGNCRSNQQPADRRKEDSSKGGDAANRMKGIPPSNEYNSSSITPRFPYSDAGKMVRKRTYTKVKEKRKSKLETSLCDSLKNTQQQQQQHYPSTLPSAFPKQGTPPTSAFTVFQGQLKDSLQAKSSAMDSYDSDATKSASDIYCSSSGSDDEEDNFVSKTPNSTFRTNLIKLPGVVSSNNNNNGIVASTHLMYTSTLMTLSSVSSSLDVSRNKPLLLNHLSVPQTQLNSDLETSAENMFGDATKGFRKTKQDSSVDPSPIKMVEDMVSGLLTTRNSLAEVTALMMSKVEFDKRRKLPVVEISEPGPADKRETGGTSGLRMDEAIHQSVTNHLKHLDNLKSSPLIKPSSISFPPQSSVPLPSLTIPDPTSGFSLPSSVDSKMDSNPSAPNSDAFGGVVMSTPGFFFSSPPEAVNKLIPKMCSSNASKSSNPSVSKATNVGGEEMFSEDEEDNNSCVVIENWLEEGCLDKSGGGGGGGDHNTVARVSASEVKPKESGGNLVVQLVDDDLMKTTGTQTSTPASNVSNSTLELVDHDGDSRETICCTGVENTISLDDTTFASIVSSSLLPSIPSKTSPINSLPTSAIDNSSVGSSQNIVSCISTSNIISLATISNECNMSSVLAPQQVPQAQVVMLPTQQPFLIPHHQTFDAQLYQTSPAGYLQSLGFGFAQGQVGLLHFGQVVAPASTSSSQGLGLALGLGVSLSGSAGREQTNPSSLESVQNSSSTSLVNTSSSSNTSQSSGQEASTQCGSDSSLLPTNQDQSQASTSSVTANQLFQLVVSQGVQPAHHILVPNYSSFAPFAGAALVPVPMVQQNSMAFCNLVAASGAPTLFTVGQSPFGFVAGPAAMQMLTGVNVGEKRQESTASHDAPDSTVDSEDAVVVPCTSGNNSGEDGGNSSVAPSASDSSCGAQAISSSRSSTESMTSQAGCVASVPSSCISSRLEESLKDVNELSSSSETDDEIGFVMMMEGCSKDDVDDAKDDDEEEEDRVGREEVDCYEVEKNEGLENKKKLAKKNNNSSKTLQYVGVTKLLKQTKNKKLKAFLTKSRLTGKSMSHLSRTSVGRGASRASNLGRAFSPALSGMSENNSEVASGETTTPCSSSGDCRVTTTDSTATESAYRADMSQSRPLSTCKDILSKNLRKNKGKLRLSCQSQQKPDSPISSDDTIDDVDSTTTTTPISCQGSRSFNIGDLVWGPARGFPSWPGKLVSENEVRGNPKSESGKIWVKWFGDNTYAQTDPDQLKTLSEGLETHHNARKSHRRGRKMNAGLEAAIQEAMTELDRQMADHKSSCSSGGSTSGGSTCSGDRPNKKSRRC